MTTVKDTIVFRGELSDFIMKAYIQEITLNMYAVLSEVSYFENNPVLINAK